MPSATIGFGLTATILADPPAAIKLLRIAAPTEPGLRDAPTRAIAEGENIALVSIGRGIGLIISVTEYAFTLAATVLGGLEGGVFGPVVGVCHVSLIAPGDKGGGNDYDREFCQ